MIPQKMKKQNGIPCLKNLIIFSFLVNNIKKHTEKKKKKPRNLRERAILMKFEDDE